MKQQQPNKISIAIRLNLFSPLLPTLIEVFHFANKVHTYRSALIQPLSNRSSIIYGNPEEPSWIPPVAILLLNHQTVQQWWLTCWISVQSGVNWRSFWGHLKTRFVACHAVTAWPKKNAAALLAGSVVLDWKVCRHLPIPEEHPKTSCPEGANPQRIATRMFGTNPVVGNWFLLSSTFARGWNHR